MGGHRKSAAPAKKAGAHCCAAVGAGKAGNARAARRGRVKVIAEAAVPFGEAEADSEREAAELSGVEEEHRPRHKRRRCDHENDEPDYERVPRQQAATFVSDAEDENKLPIKLPNGRIKLLKRQKVQKIQQASSKSEAVADKEQSQENAQAEDVEHVEEKGDRELPVSRRVYIAQKKEEMASTARRIIEDPESNVERLSHMRAVAGDADPKVRKLGMLAQLSVYRDIIPGYQIRSLTQQEQQGPVSKAVKKLRKFEKSLLTQYQCYLQALEAALNAKDGDPSIRLVAAMCMCSLLDAVPHFNFRLNLMTAIVGCLASKRNTEIFNVCCDCIANAFKNDVSGEVSLDAVRLITKMIKSKGYVVRQEVLETFLHLRLRDELVSPQNAGEGDGSDRLKQRGRKRRRHEERKQTHMSQKAKKLAKLNKEVEREMREAEAEVDKETKQKNQTETLQHMFVCYFRILKHAKTSPLLPAVLEGLAMFAHLINVDFFRDILTVLKQIMTTGVAALSGAAPATQAGEESFEATSTTSSPTVLRASLLCIIAAFQLLVGQGDALHIDLRDFYTHLYALLPRIAIIPEVESHQMASFSEDDGTDERAVNDKKDKKVLGRGESFFKQRSQITHGFRGRVPSLIELLLRAMDLLFVKRRQIPPERVAAFLKRLTTISLQLPAQSVLECLHVIDELLKKFPKCDQLLAPNDDKMANGVYRPDVDDPDACNPFATNLWELNLLTKHYDDQVQKAARRVLMREKRE